MRTPNRPSPIVLRASQETGTWRTSPITGSTWSRPKARRGITQAMYGNSGYGLQLSRSPYLARLTWAGFCSAAGSGRATQPSAVHHRGRDPLGI